MHEKLIFIDLDGTLTPQSTWYELNMMLGITPEEDKALFERYLKDEISYTEWNKELVSIYRSRRSVSRADIMQFVETIVLRPEAATMVQALKEKGYWIVLWSGSVDVVVGAIARKVGANDWLSTARLVFDDAGLLVDIIDLGNEAPAKEKIAEEYAIKHKCDLSKAYAIDDGGNGVELFQRVKGIVLGDNEKLKPLAWKQVQSLSEIPALL
jgi:phosphoserine phosphatase